MSITPAGILSLPLQYLRATLAASTTFQTWTGAADAAAALDFILPVLAQSIDPPFIVIDWQTFERRNEGTTHFTTSGSLQFSIHGPIDPAHSEADAAFEFLNKVGAIIKEAEENAGEAGYLDFASLSMVSLDRPNEQEMQSSGDYYQAVFTLHYEDQA